MVEGIPWGAPEYILSVEPLTIFEERSADATMGTIWSSSPCRIRVGTSNLLRSSVRSVSEKALIQSNAALCPHKHALQPEGVAQPVRNFRARPVETVKGKAEIFEELSAIVQYRSAKLIKHLDWQASRVLGGLQHQRRDSADQYGFGYAARPVAADVPRDFSAAGGMSDVDRVAKVKRRNKFGEIIGVGIHIVAVPGLSGTSVTSAVVRNAAISAGGKEDHLVLPRVRAQGPTVAEDERLSFAPVLVINLSTIFGCDCWHSFPFLKLFS